MYWIVWRQYDKNKLVFWDILIQNKTSQKGLEVANTEQLAFGMMVGMHDWQYLGRTLRGE